MGSDNIAVETAVFSRYDSSKPPQNGCHPTRGEVTTEVSVEHCRRGSGPSRGCDH